MSIVLGIIGISILIFVHELGHFLAAKWAGARVKTFALGFDPIWFGIIVVKMLEIGLITPPVGIQAYVLKGVAPPEITLGDIFRGFVPFFLVDLFVVIGLLTLFPQIVTFLPSLMK